MARGRRQPVELPPKWPVQRKFRITANDDRDEFITDVTHLLVREFESGYHLDWNASDEVGLSTCIDGYLTRNYIDEDGITRFNFRGWSRLFHMQDTVYRELCWEFFVAFSYEEDSTDFTDQRVLTFRLGGVHHGCSIIELAYRLGIYTYEETTNEYFLPFLKTCIVHPPQEYDQDDFWVTNTISG